MKQRLLTLLKSRPHTCALCEASLELEIKELLAFYETPVGDRPKKKRSKININIDHIVPHSKGGLGELFNLQMTHATCNNKKGSDHVDNSC